MSAKSSRRTRALRAAFLICVAALPALTLTTPANAATSKQVRVNITSGVRCVNVEATEDQVAGIRTDGVAGWKDTGFFVGYGDTISVSTWTGSPTSNGRRCDGNLVKSRTWLQVPDDNLTYFWVDMT